MKKLYEILVPTLIDRDEVGGTNTTAIRTRYHRVWDERVRKISNGLTILRPAKGQWEYKGRLYEERMIPVRIACTAEQMEEILRIVLH